MYYTGEIMIISEKQIMQLILIARAYAEELKSTGNQVEKLTSESVTDLIYAITRQQSEELKEIT